VSARLVGSVIATTIGLAFWWALTEPLPIPPAILLGVPAAILLCSGIIAGRLGAIASPVGLLFSLLLGSILATAMHQLFEPLTPPVSSFGPLLVLGFPDLVPPLLLACALGVAGGVVGERLMQRGRP
jgi:hypothetical protein